MIRSEESDSSETNESRGGHFSGELEVKLSGIHLIDELFPRSAISEVSLLISWFVRIVGVYANGYVQY